MNDILILDDDTALVLSEVIYLCRSGAKLTYGMRGGGHLATTYGTQEVPDFEAARAQCQAIRKRLGWEKPKRKAR